MAGEGHLLWLEGSLRRPRYLVEFYQSTESEVSNNRAAQCDKFNNF